jgi:hypothetical protein
MMDEWLKFKKYPHIGKPLRSKKDKAWILQYVKDPKNIAKHKFVPLLHKTLVQRKYRPLPNAPKNEFGKRKRTVKDPKERHIYYPSHIDSIVYSYYNYKLVKAYEYYLLSKKYNSVVVAYRKIPIGNGKKGKKSNIEFAFDAFKFIECNKHRKLSIIIADVTSFFENLDHRILHRQWKRILNESYNLPDDHYAIYKSLVDFKYVNENELFKRFQNQLIVERSKPNYPAQKELKPKKVNKIYNIRNENVVAYCDTNDFFKRATDLIRVDKPYNTALRNSNNMSKKKGIPQGTPISATLANIYMLDFDERIYNEANSYKKNAYYQRYSDDIIIICDQKDEKYFTNLLEEEIELKAKLEIQISKTNIYHYEYDNHLIFRGGMIKENAIHYNKQLEYLGFEYDGQHVRVKTAAFSKFYRNMRRSFKRGAHFAKASHIPSDSLYETRLYKRYTHLGSYRRYRWKVDKRSSTGYSPSKYYDWGNFISYLNKANEVMRPINGDDRIAKQYRRIWGNFHSIKKEIYADIEKVVKARNKQQCNKPS